MKLRTLILTALLLAVAVAMPALAADATAEGETTFTWKNYQMCFPYMTTDMAGRGLESFQGTMALVRLAPTEGTFAFSDFQQQLFELVDSDGEIHPCRFFILANTSKNPVMKGMPDPQQDFIDLLFEMDSPTSEGLAAASVNVYEANGAEPLVVPLSSVPQALEQ